MTTDMHKAPSVARNTGTSGDNATSVARYDLSTSEGGRSYISHFFATELRRHDFTDYIATHLAADFACALAQHLAATGKQQVGEVQGDARAQFEAWHCEKFKSRWQTGAPTRDMHNGVHAEKYGPAEQQVRWEAWQAAWQAALAARQPVCGTCAEVIEPDALMGTTCDCARQPGARVPVGYLFTDDPAVYAMPGSGFHSGKEPPADAINVVPVYAAPSAQGIDQAAGVRAIADERQRQVHAEGFSAENDADYKAGVLANAALAYLQVAAMDLAAGGRAHIATGAPPACWPWHRLWWKPRDARRDLVRAGALIAAQLDAIDGQRDAAPGVNS